MDTRVKAIAELNSTLMHPDQLGGLFLPPDYSEHFELVLLGEMPSLNEPHSIEARRTNFNFNVTSRDKFVHEMMIKHGVAGNYVTDIVKTRAQPGRPTPAQVLAWLPFLLREIAIIQPRVVIVLGKRTYERSFLPHIARKIPAEIRYDYVFHYSNQVSRSKFEQRFSEVITALLPPCPPP